MFSLKCPVDSTKAFRCVRCGHLADARNVCPKWQPVAAKGLRAHAGGVCGGAGHGTVAAPIASSESLALSLQARLANGVAIDLRGFDLRSVGDVIEALRRLRCSVSTKA